MQRKKYNCNYNIPDVARDIIEALNLLSDDKIGFDEIKIELIKCHNLK